MGNVILTGTGGIAGTITGGTTTTLSTKGVGNGTTFPVVFTAQQIIGLSKMTPCNFTDCRESSQIWCYSLPAFGASSNNQPASYSNDIMSYLVNFSGNGTPKFTLQKAAGTYFDESSLPWTWNTVSDITDNTYGMFYPLGSLWGGHPNWMLFQINWGNVYTRQGQGFYRILFQSCQTTPGQGATNASATFHQAYSAGSSNSTPVWCSVKIVCGSKTYQTPQYYGIPTTPFVVAFINALTGPSFPFTATNNGGVVQITGTGGAAQNGCVATQTFIMYTNNSAKSGPIIWQETFDAITLIGGNTVTPITTCTCGLQSPTYFLQQWDCMKADRTVKFESWNTGTVGDVDNPGNLFNLCGISIYDSIRLEGTLGKQEFTYDELLIEYGFSNTNPFGDISRVRDKAIPGYKFQSEPLPLWVHQRLAIYGLMADTLLGSDYNINNSNWNIQRKKLIKKGGYKPTYYDQGNWGLALNDWQRRSMIEIEFLEGIQSIIKSTCCEATN